MHFLHGWKRDRTCELNFQEKGSRYVDIISVYFSGRTGDGSHLPKVKAAGKIILSVAVLAIINSILGIRTFHGLRVHD